MVCGYHNEKMKNEQTSNVNGTENENGKGEGRGETGGQKNQADRDPTEREKGSESETTQKGEKQRSTTTTIIVGISLLRFASSLVGLVCGGKRRPRLGGAQGQRPSMRLRPLAFFPLYQPSLSGPVCIKFISSSLIPMPFLPFAKQTTRAPLKHRSWRWGGFEW